MLSRHPEHEQAIASRLRRRINQIREDRDRGPVEYSGALNDICTDYAEQMALAGTLSHKLNESTPQERADNYSQVGENIHREQSLRTDCHRIAERTASAWIQSPPHRQNMLREQVTVGGVGVSQSGDWFYVCLLLSTGKKAQAKVGDRVRGWLRR